MVEPATRLLFVPAALALNLTPGADTTFCRAQGLRAALAADAGIAAGGLAANGAVGVFAGGIGARLAGSPGLARWLGRATAAIFAGLAARLALMARG